MSPKRFTPPALAPASLEEITPKGVENDHAPTIVCEATSRLKVPVSGPLPKLLQNESVQVAVPVKTRFSTCPLAAGARAKATRATAEMKLDFCIEVVKTRDKCLRI